ncbi:MAG: hypothetical protein KGV44_11630 [Flavobacteriaceae bacterium]|nr:hypothetical protein [Flavobacteriaceae bacterium]
MRKIKSVLQKIKKIFNIRFLTMLYLKFKGISDLKFMIGEKTVVELDNSAKIKVKKGRFYINAKWDKKRAVYNLSFDEKEFKNYSKKWF